MSFPADKKINEITFDGDEREALLKAAPNYLRFIEQSSNFSRRKWETLVELNYWKSVNKVFPIILLGLPENGWWRTECKTTKTTCKSSSHTIYAKFMVIRWWVGRNHYKRYQFVESVLDLIFFRSTWSGCNGNSYFLYSTLWSRCWKWKVRVNEKNSFEFYATWWPSWSLRDSYKKYFTI